MKYCAVFGLLGIYLQMFYYITLVEGLFIDKSFVFMSISFFFYAILGFLHLKNPVNFESCCLF